MIKLVTAHIVKIETHADLGLYSIFLQAQKNMPITIMEYWSTTIMGHKRGEVCLLCDPDIVPRGRKEYFKCQLAMSEEQTHTFSSMDNEIKELSTKSFPLQSFYNPTSLFQIKDFTFDYSYFIPAVGSYRPVYMAQPIEKLLGFCSTRVADLESIIYAPAAEEAASVRAQRAAEIAAQVATAPTAASVGGAASSSSSSSEPVFTLASKTILGTRGKSRTVYEPAIVVSREAQTFFSPVAPKRNPNAEIVYRRFLEYRDLTLEIRKKDFGEGASVSYQVIYSINEWIMSFNGSYFYRTDTRNPYFTEEDRGKGLEIQVDLEIDNARDIIKIYVAGLYNKLVDKRGIAIDVLCIILSTMLAEKPWQEKGLPAPKYITLMALGSGPPQPTASSSSSSSSSSAGGGLAPIVGLSAQQREDLDPMLRLVAYYKSLGFKRQKGIGYVNDKFPGKEGGSLWSLQTNNPPSSWVNDYRFESTYFSVPLNHEQVEAVLEALYP